LSNIGDTKTLVIHPASTISLHSTKQQQEEAGVFDDLIRISVGIEDIEDLRDDFSNAFASLNE
jgi:O-acetylhomoserine (thiol)-lyase